MNVQSQPAYRSVGGRCPADVRRSSAHRASGETPDDIIEDIGHWGEKRQLVAGSRSLCGSWSQLDAGGRYPAAATRDRGGGRKPKASARGPLILLPFPHPPPPKDGSIDARIPQGSHTRGAVHESGL